MKTSAITLFLLSSILFSCDNSKKRTIQVDETKIEESLRKPDSHNSMNSLDWNGTYKGILPCADCEGIETILTLNPDQTYILVTNYLGRNDALEEEKKGSFSWNEAGSIITLTNITSGPNQYKVGENRIWHLDINGEIITGDLADHYVLIKSF
ncbi:copper resistance protein NlpE [Algoriphagus marinus]|uniref:copper resistance protein NlpE n=1 Tax=Algoriphagus marinus TaxID=1925762 RepID=UPI00094BAE40|nr:copper resistance protein NlpE [Algoriphagus marinus]